MSRVHTVLVRKGITPVTVQPQTSVYDALKIMAEKNIGSLIVMDNNEYVGIVTERDYSRKVILQDKHSNSTPVSEIMSTDLPRVNTHDSIDDCMERMTSNNVRYLPVFDSNNALAGIISMSDVVKDTILSQQQTINQLNEYIHS